MEENKSPLGQLRILFTAGVCFGRPRSDAASARWLDSNIDVRRLLNNGMLLHWVWCGVAYQGNENTSVRRTVEVADLMVRLR
jgi:hypothetical protein